MEYIIKTYKFKLKLTNNQRNRIDNWIDACRNVYNLAHETKINAYDSHRVTLSCFDLIKQLPVLKKGISRLEDVPAESLQDVIERLDKSYQNFFKGRGFPKFINKEGYNSITFKSIKINTHNRVKLPKIGSVKYFNSQEIKGELRRATITRENNNYYISVLTKQKTSDLPYLCDSQTEIGLDMGIAYFLVTSDGEYINNPRFLEKSLKQLRIEQRSLARKTQGSSNYYKQKEVIGRLYNKIKNQRKDFLDKLSTKLALENSLIAVEKLSVDGMVKNKNISLAISDVSWGMFFEKLKYKTDWYGGSIERVSPAFTSQTCSACGYVDKKNRLTQSDFKCIKCGHKENADLNASKNILDRALSNLREREALVCA